MSQEIAVRPKMFSVMEAEQKLQAINRFIENGNTNFTNALIMLSQFDAGMGWKVLGFNSMKECYQDRFPCSDRQYWRLYDAAYVRLTLQLGEDLMVPPSVLVPLAKLADETQAEVWEDVTGGDPKVVPTATMVQEAIVRHKAVPELPAGGTTTVQQVNREPGDDDEEPAAEPFQEDDRTEADYEAEFKTAVVACGVHERLVPYLQKRYMADALAWYRTKDGRARYLAELRHQANGAKKVCASQTPQFLNKQIVSLGRRGPMEWKLCRDCEGTGKRSVAGQTVNCQSCDLQGYVL